MHESDETEFTFESECEAVATNEAVDVFQKGDLCGYNRKGINDADKFELLTVTYDPPSDYQYHSKKYGKQFRRFQASWIKKWPVLRYSQAEDGLYCIHCFLFTGSLIDVPLSDWKNVSAKIEKHVGSSHNSLHNLASDLSVTSGQQENISCQISSVTNKKVAQNEAILKAMIKCIILWSTEYTTARQTDESSNFMAFRAETDKNLKIHLSSAP